MGKKVALTVMSVAGTPNNNRIYALIMGEKEGNRYFPIIVNEAEAQSVVVQMQKISLPRPVIHDVFADYIRSTGQSLEEVFIFNVISGVFYAHLIFREGLVIEARAADAIALALRFSCPIYALDSIVESENIQPDIERAAHHSVRDEIERLNRKLEQAVRSENYEEAARLRDIINELSSHSETADDNNNEL